MCDIAEGCVMRLRFDLAYDGGKFYGWAKQPALRTVQGEMEDALHKILRVPVSSAEEPLACFAYCARRNGRCAS